MIESHLLDEKILVASPQQQNKRIMVAVDENNSDVLVFLPKEQYAPGGMYEVDEPVYREIMEYEYINPHSSYLIMTASALEGIKGAQNIDPIASLGRIRNKNAGKATTRKKKSIEEALRDGESE